MLRALRTVASSNGFVRVLTSSSTVGPVSGYQYWWWAGSRATQSFSMSGKNRDAQSTWSAASARTISSLLRKRGTRSASTAGLPGCQ